MRRHRFRTLLVALGTLLVGGSTVLWPGVAHGADDPARELAERFRPVIVIKDQRFDCDSEGEAWTPTDVGAVLGNPDVVLRQEGPGRPVLRTAPDASDLWRSGTAVHLDLPGTALQPGCTYEDDFEIYRTVETPTVYARVATQADRPGVLVLQYWFFWYYNRWNDLHEGDWEGIQLLFEADDPARATEPFAVAYAQHEGGETAEWTSTKLERDGDRPVVYSSAGSHASYFSPAIYLGRGASTGFGCDDTAGPSERLDPAIVMLPSTIEEITGPDDPMAWVAFEGRWGELNTGPYSGPTGPITKTRWDAPVDWYESLRPSSVVVPASDSFAAPLVDTFCAVATGGSRAVIEVQISPWRLIIPAAIVALVARFLVRRTTWGPTGLEPVVRRRSTGEILRSAFGAYRHHGRRLAPLGLLALPTAAIAGVTVALVDELPAIGPLLDLGGRSSALSVVTASLTGGAVGLTAVTITTAGVAAILTGEATSAGGAVRSIGRRLGALLINIVLATLAVSVLTISIIGLPIAIWLAVRLRLFAPATMAGHGAPGALLESYRTVSGRWFKVAIASLAVNGAIVAVAAGVGLIVLITVTAFPLWVFSFIAVLITVLLAPLAGVVDVLLYGDAVAERDSPDAPDGARSLSVSVGSE